MLSRLNHVAIAVRDAENAAKIYGAAFDAEVSAAVPLPERCHAYARVIGRERA